MGVAKMAKRDRQEIKTYTEEDYSITTTDAMQLLDIELVYDYDSLPQEHRDDVMARARNIKRNERRSVQTMVAVGQDLIAVQDLLPHGQFLPWIEQEFGWERTTAYNLINLAKKFPASGLPETLGLTVLTTLTAAKTPDSAVAEVLERVEAGDNITKAIAVQIVREHRDAEKKPHSIVGNEAVSLIWRAVRRYCPQCEDRQRYDWLETADIELFRGMVHKNAVFSAESFLGARATVLREMMLRIDHDERMAERIAAQPTPAATSTFVPAAAGITDPKLSARSVLVRRLRGAKADLDELGNRAADFDLAAELKTCTDTLNAMLQKLEDSTEM